MMNMLRTGMNAALSGAGMCILGCDVMLNGHSRREDRVYVQQQPQAVYVQPQPAYVQPQAAYVQPQAVYVEPQPQYVIVQQAPPPLILERRPPPPSGLHVWIDGSWNWSGQRYSWQAGRYELPPQPGAVWVAARYESDSHRYTQGQWKRQDKGNDHDHH